MKYLIVLDDGETYSALEGCSIVAVPDDFDFENIVEALKNQSEPDSRVIPVGAFYVWNEVPIFETSESVREL